MQQQESQRIYPGREAAFDKELACLQKDKLSPKNKELIGRFHSYLFSTGSGNIRVAKLSSQMRKLCRDLQKDLDSSEREDLIELVSLINRNPDYADATKADYRRCLKQFFKWFKDEDSRLESNKQAVRFERKKFYKFIESDVSTGFKLKQADPNTIISEEECQNIIEKGCTSPKQKAFIAMLHESGCRAREFLDMKIGDIKFRENHAEITVDGKTGKRTIFVVKALPFLLRYIDVHPLKNNMQGYLWISDSQFNRAEPLLHKGAQKLVEKVFERAGLIHCEYFERPLENGKIRKILVKKTIVKRCNLHWFRHSRATILAPKMTEAMLCKYMGWRLGSRQIKTYCHLSVKQLEDVIMDLNGIKPQEKNAEAPIKCACGTLNNQTERYCFKCFRPLKVETVIQDNEIVGSGNNETVKFMMEMMKNPEMIRRFQKFKEDCEKPK